MNSVAAVVVISFTSSYTNVSMIFHDFLSLQIESDLAYQMVSVLDEYGHHSTKKITDIHINTENIGLLVVKVSANSSVS